MQSNEEIQNLIASTWNSNPEDLVTTRISNCRKEISKWNRENHINNKKVIEATRIKLDEAMSCQTPMVMKLPSKV